MGHKIFTLLLLINTLHSFYTVEIQCLASSCGFNVSLDSTSPFEIKCQQRTSSSVDCRTRIDFDLHQNTVSFEFSSSSQPLPSDASVYYDITHSFFTSFGTVKGSVFSIMFDCFRQNECDLFYANQTFHYFQERIISSFPTLSDQLSEILFDPDKSSATPSQCYINDTTLQDCTGTCSFSGNEFGLRRSCSSSGGNYIIVNSQKRLSPKSAVTRQIVSTDKDFRLSYYCNIDLCNDLERETKVRELLQANYENLGIYVPNNFIEITTTTITTTPRSTTTLPSSGSFHPPAFTFKLILLTILIFCLFED